MGGSVFPSPVQSALTIARLLMEVISCHGVPRELLSDRGAAFLSKLLHKIYHLMGIHKISTTTYHPQTDGLVERFHCMLSKNNWKWGIGLGRSLAVRSVLIPMLQAGVNP